MSTTPLSRLYLSLQRETLLVLLPTVMLLLWLPKLLSNQHMLFASLVSNCFFIYLDPSH